MSQIHAAAEAAIRSRIGAVSGTHIEQFRAREDASRVAIASKRWIEVDISLTGWSCSMHRQAMRWRETIELEKGLGGVDQARCMRGMFALRIAKQMERLQTGVSMGLALPMYSGVETGTIDVMHLTVDRAAAMLMGTREEFLARVRESIHSLHQEPADGLRDDIAGDDMVMGRLWNGMVQLADGAIFYGDKLWVRHTLPDTVIVAAEGRTLGEIVSGLPESVASRRILGAQRPQDTEGVEFDVRPEIVTIQRLMEEWPTA